MQDSKGQITKFIDRGLCGFKKMWDFQEKLLKEKTAMKLKAEKSDNYLIFCEHPHVYTIGKSGNPNNLLVQDDLLKGIGAEYHRINRGGDITYHGPGQIVAYPIIDLEVLGIGVKEYVQRLEEAAILCLKEFGIEAERKEGATGVWLDVESSMPRKICAIGIRVSRGISMHGLAFNINTDLKYYEYINPCGFTETGITSLEKEMGQPLDINYVKEILKDKIREQFNIIWK